MSNELQRLSDNIGLILNSRVGRTTKENGEIFNDYTNNTAIGNGASAKGLNTHAGTFARKIIANGITTCKDEASMEYYKVTVHGLVNTDSQCVDKWVATTVYDSSVSDLITIDCKTHLSNALYIADISEDVTTNTTTVTLKRVDNRNFTPPLMDDTSGMNTEEDWIYVPGKCNGELSPQFTSAFASGKDSIATGFASVSMGRANISAGNYSITLGRGNKASYAGVAAGVYNEAGNGGIALGNSNRALGDAAVATGTNTYARAASSRAGGRYSEALSEFTVAEGLGVRAGLKQGQVVHGKYNIRSDSHLFIIGDGTADDKRHDAFVITDTYKVLLNNNSIELATVEQVNNLLQGSLILNDKNNIASGTQSLATGSGTQALGNYSFAACVGSKATARSAVAMGEYNNATQNGAFAAGINTEANGYATSAIGYGVKTNNYYEVYGQMATGKYNLPNSYSLFMVGNGLSKDERKNIFEIRKDGSAYLETQGEYDNSVVIKKTLDKKLQELYSQKQLIRTFTGGSVIPTIYPEELFDSSSARYVLEVTYTLAGYPYRYNFDITNDNSIYSGCGIIPVMGVNDETIYSDVIFTVGNGISHITIPNVRSGDSCEAKLYKYGY